MVRRPGADAGKLQTLAIERAPQQALVTHATPPRASAGKTTTALLSAISRDPHT
jgi:hypothetical protein